MRVAEPKPVPVYFDSALIAKFYLTFESLDALHLVTAKSENFDRIYSNDRYVLAAARSFGLHGVDRTLRERPG
jgi:predicted nucleic acid-binding protein